MHSSALRTRGSTLGCFGPRHPPRGSRGPASAGPGSKEQLRCQALAIARRTRGGTDTVIRSNSDSDLACWPVIHHGQGDLHKTVLKVEQSTASELLSKAYPLSIDLFSVCWNLPSLTRLRTGWPILTASKTTVCGEKQWSKLDKTLVACCRSGP